MYLKQSLVCCIEVWLQTVGLCKCPNAKLSRVNNGQDNKTEKDGGEYHETTVASVAWSFIGGDFSTELECLGRL